jgi:hypothetical protein
MLCILLTLFRLSEPDFCAVQDSYYSECQVCMHLAFDSIIHVNSASQAVYHVYHILVTGTVESFSMCQS